VVRVKSCKKLLSRAFSCVLFYSTVYYYKYSSYFLSYSTIACFGNSQTGIWILYLG
jgi:hypothetical protein